MRRHQRITVLLVFVAAAPIAAIPLWSIFHTVLELSDPCAKWDHPPEQPVDVHVEPQDVCRERTVHGESKARATIRTALVPGGLLVAAVFAVVGAALPRRRLMWTAAIGMLVETLVVFTIAPLTFFAGVSFLLLAKRLQPSA